MNGATRPQPALPHRGRETTGLRALPKRRGELSGLSVVQWSAVTQMELSQVLMVRSAGELEVVVPAIDDDGWDAKVHLRGEFGSELTIQAKCTGHLLVRESRAPDLKIHFKLPRRRILNDRRFWFFIAHFDLERMLFSDPVFLVPSATLHEHARPREDGEKMNFSFVASMSPNSKDKWRPYQVPLAELADRFVHMLRRPDR